MKAKVRKILNEGKKLFDDKLCSASICENSQYQTISGIQMNPQRDIFRLHVLVSLSLGSVAARQKSS